jgi:hypothetical protein
MKNAIALCLILNVSELKLVETVPMHKYTGFIFEKGQDHAAFLYSSRTLPRTISVPDDFFSDKSDPININFECK